MGTRTKTVGELARSVPESRLIGDGSATITEVVYDSRDVVPGSLFAALRGADFDGHDFIDDALSRGAEAVLTEQPLDLPVPQLIAENSRQALAAIAAEFFDRPSQDLSAVGITGTDGKTTTSFLVDGLLRSAGRTTGMIGTVVVRIGDELDFHAARQTTPESTEIQRFLRRMVDRGVEWATLEATSHGLDLYRLDHTRFEIAAVTNVTHEHLEHHKTIEAYRRAKAILFERTAAENGTSVVNLDDPGAREMLRYVGDSPRICYSLDEVQRADLRASEIAPEASGTGFCIHWRGESRAVWLPLIGRFNVENALCAAGVALAAGLTLEQVSDGLAVVEPVPGRMAPVEMGQPFSVIVDYAHTPAALETALTLLRGLHPNGRLIAVSGSAGDRDVTKRPLQGAVSARLADFSVFTSEDPRNEDPEEIIREIADGASKAGARLGETMACEVDRREAIRLALSLARDGDCVLLAGKGHEGSIIWGREKRPWDEATVAGELLSELGFAAERGRVYSD